MIGRLLDWLRAPGFIRPFEYDDPDTGEKVTLRTSPLFTILTVGPKEFYFYRASGKFDGTGAMAVDDDYALTRLRAESIRRSTAARAGAARPHRP
jgi:hypothetical protein